MREIKFVGIKYAECNGLYCKFYKLLTSDKINYCRKMFSSCFDCYVKVNKVTKCNP